MTTRSEDVLLQIPHVRYKKGDGTLFLMDQRLIWMVENRDTVAVSHLYVDIKSQKISPVGKVKVQLQVVLHNGVSSTFHFINRNGVQAQLADRDKIKEMLQTLLPKFKRKVDRELEEKNKILSSNPSLLQLYKDLVMTEIITSEEFWSQHAVQYTQKQKQQPQEIGVSGAFLADIKPQTDGCNGLKYNITPEIIECIFKTYPAVRKKFIENVPSKLSESQFWTKFFQSHYFHRDRKYAEAKDLFTECGRIDDQEMKRDIQVGVSDPLVNLVEFDDKHLDEGYGLAASERTVHSGTSSQAMIKRFNQHSIMVLKTTRKRDATDSNANVTTTTTAINGTTTPIRNHQTVATTSTVANGERSETAGWNTSKRMRIQSKITYDDLESDTTTVNPSQQLALSKVERYLQGPIATGGGLSGSETHPTCVGVNVSCDVTAVTKVLLQETRCWQGKHATQSVLVSPAAAVSALGELSPGGALMRGFQEQSLAQLVPSDIENEVRKLYFSLCQLLNHFWRCFPPSTGQLEQKAIQMHEALHRFHTVKLKPFEERLLRELSPLSQHLTKHLNQLLNAAYQKFTNWQKIKHR